MNAQEFEIDEFVERVFAKKPLYPKSIGLQIDSSNNNVDEMFKFFVELFTKGMALRYSDLDGKVHLDKCSDEEFAEMRQYFNSFGVELFMEKVNIKTGEKSGATPKTLTDLNEKVVNLTVGDMKYVLSFDFL